MHDADGNHSSDQLLLRRYADLRDDMAFTKVVQRHVRLVYSAALRRVGEPAMADDVTQAVFITLARKARSASREATVSRWLLSTVRYVAANARKSESRRQRREQAVAILHGEGRASIDPSEVILWQEASKLLDDAVLSLRAIDRTLVLLRYFEARSVAEIAATLHLSEGAVKQRLARAIDRLRRRLQRRDAAAGTLPAQEFSAMLLDHAVKPAPLTLVGSTCSTVLNGGGAVNAISLSNGAIKMMHWSNLKLATALAGVALLGGLGSFVGIHHAAAADAPQAPALPTPAPAAHDPNAITNVADTEPVVVRTVPEAGSEDVDPSITEIRVTYSKPMLDHSWSFCQTSAENFPELTGKPQYDADGRTCVLPVKLQPERVYALYLNRGQFMNFKDAQHREAVPYALVFGTRR